MGQLSVSALTFLRFEWLLPSRLISLGQLTCNHNNLVAARISSSSIEYLSAWLYNSSIVGSRSKNSDWKKGVDGPKLLLNFWRTTSMLYDSIFWTACQNLLVKSQIDSSSCLRIVYKELMFLFCHTEQRYCDNHKCCP